jgi:hypothetical protein
VTITAFTLYSLNEAFSLTCWRCGRGEPDLFENEADAELLLHPHQLPWGRAARVPQVLTLRTVHQADLQALRPAHRRCLPRPEPRPRREGEPPYDLLRSVL